MSVENLNRCSKLTYPIVKHPETIKFDNDSCDLVNWSTETHETFIFPKVEDHKIGKRRELLMKYFRMQACKDALEEIVGDPPLAESSCLSEYIDNFCDNDFIPLMEKSELYVQNFTRYPLYGGDIQTYYKEQFDKGKLTNTATLQNKKRPFIRRSLFTTPPELALDEPMDGF